ncbi:hypothetical protein GE09DRAFT_1161685 [Coniochaeta sp. 2T2.1]|nr:hypothetical protein GE09DRAFT_1161685 [Coniochaeta sp. 2T2.1]
MAESIEKAFNSWLRKFSRLTSRQQNPGYLIRCPICGNELQNATEATFDKHLRTEHHDLISKARGKGSSTTVSDLWSKANEEISRTTTPNRCVPTSLLHLYPIIRLLMTLFISRARDSITESGFKSPASSLRREGRSLSPEKRSRARATPTSTPGAPQDVDAVKRPPAKGTLWTPDFEPQRRRPLEKANIAVTHRARLSNSPPQSPKQRHRPSVGGGGGLSQPSSSKYQPAQHQEFPYEPPGEDTTSLIIKQPETKPISQEQLVAEVKGIYAGLIMVETKCIEVDNAQNAQTDATNKLNDEQWQALIALHRTLLHEHHDFFLASQHPNAAPALRRLATKYAMPARMWRHGIHSFLELLRHRLPGSREHLLTFIYLAYSTMAQLYQTVPAFEDTWIECLGDLGRYRMAIEDDDARHREIWTAVSRHWYSKASDKSPTTGRLYHHLAILVRPNGFQQLFYYTKSMCVAIQFDSARESVMTLLDPIMALGPNQVSRFSTTELEFIRCHGIMFSKKFPEKFEKSADDFIDSLDNFIASIAGYFVQPSYWIGMIACCAIAGYGNERHPFFEAIRNPLPEQQGGQQVEKLDDVPKETMAAITLTNRTHTVIFQRYGDNNILSYIHVTLVFMYHLTFLPEVDNLVAKEFPWKLLTLMLNYLVDSAKDFERIEGEAFPNELEKGDSRRPLPEDYAMRGLLWTDDYFPPGHFDGEQRDDDEKYMELPSMVESRKERVLYLGCHIAARGEQWLRYDRAEHRFHATETKTDPEQLPDAA